MSGEEREQEERREDSGGEMRGEEGDMWKAQTT